MQKLNRQASPGAFKIWEILHNWATQNCTEFQENELTVTQLETELVRHGEQMNTTILHELVELGYIKMIFEGRFVYYIVL